MILKNRKEELKWLNEAFKSKKAEFGIIYGRRRMGKTFLVKNFIKDKEHFYFLAKQQNIELEFNRFKEKFGKKFNIFIDSKNWEELFKEIIKNFEKNKNKFIIVIDEFPYWVIKHNPILSEFQYLWDEILNKKYIMLILSGSYISIMEQRVLGNKSPLFGRRTFQINLQPMPLKSLKEFFPKHKIEDIIKIYGITDTIPYYLSLIDQNLNFENILKKCLSQSHPIYQDGEILLYSELREYNTYINILKAILDGATKMSEISSKAKVDITNIPKYLNTLIKLNLLRKIKPITSSIKEKNYLYELEDNYYRFWLTYIFPYKEEIEESIDTHLKFIKSDYDKYISGVFEKFCRRLIRYLNFNFVKIGKWWYKDKEIDIVALNEKNKNILIGECKWKEKINPLEIVKELNEKAKSIEWNNKNRKETFIIFAKSFSKKINEFENKKVYCMDLKNIENLMKIN